MLWTKLRLMQDIQILVEEEIGPNLRQRVVLGLLNNGGGSFVLFVSEVNLLLFAIIASVIRGLLSEVCPQADLCEGRISWITYLETVLFFSEES